MSEKTIQLDAELTEVFMELEDAKAAKSEAAEREKKARDILVEALKSQGADKGLTASGGVSLTVTTRQSVNGKKLEAMYPEVYAEVLSVSDIETLRVI